MAVSSSDCNNECKSSYLKGVDIISCVSNTPHWLVHREDDVNTHRCNPQLQYNGQMSHKYHMNLRRQALDLLQKVSLALVCIVSVYDP